MANNRLELIEKKTGPYYLKGSPIILEAGALYIDKVTQNSIVQIRWRNIDKRQVNAVAVEIHGTDSFGEKVETVQYQYSRLTVSQGEDFGGKTPIIIRNNKLIKFHVLLRAVSFADGVIWRNEASEAFTLLPERKEHILEGELLEQYIRDLAGRGFEEADRFLPQKAAGLWQCGCGSWQTENEECLRCGALWEGLAQMSDETLLEEHLHEYQAEKERKRLEAEKKAEEERQAEEEARKRAEENRKKMKKRALACMAFVALVAVIALVVTQFVIPGNNYRKAMTLRDSGNYAEAIRMFTSLGDYSDAARQINATYYAEGIAKQKAGDWEGAVKAFTSAGSYNDAEGQIRETGYLHAKALMNSGEYPEATLILLDLKGYKDVDSLLANDAIIAPLAKKLKAYQNVGGIVKFGTYPQSADGGWQPIDWIVLDYDRENHRALLLSKYGLDNKPYNSADKDVTWETCSLRAWLNDSFFNTAFSMNEQKAILITTVANDASQCYRDFSTAGGRNTEDRVFLLSYAEANLYLGVTYNNRNNMNSRAAPTPYAEASNNIYTSRSDKTAEGKGADDWWLRSPGYYQYSGARGAKTGAACVGSSGNLSGSIVHNLHFLVRPAIWLDLKSVISNDSN